MLSVLKEKGKQMTAAQILELLPQIEKWLCEMLNVADVEVRFTPRDGDNTR